MFIKLQSSLCKTLRRIDNSGVACGQNVVSIFNSVLVGEYGSDVIEFVFCREYRNRTLFISCINSSIASEIQLSREKLINAVNKKLIFFGDEIIERIAFS